MARILSKTGGRAASLRHIPPKLALCVGEPSASAPKNWVWRELTTIARLESGHTPSRKHSEYWGGSLPWISIKDAKAHHGSVVEDTVEKTNQLGIENSSARLLPKNTVCLSRTASVGYVVRMGAEMATSQDFVNWVCGPKLLPEFLQQLFLSEGKDILRFASGAVHQTIYYPEAKGFWVCLPPLPEQERIVGILDEAFEGIATATAHAERNLQNARELFQSVLQSTFQQKGVDWVETTLKEEVDFAAGFAFKSKDYVKDGEVGMRLLRGDNIMQGEFRWDAAALWPEDNVDDYEKFRLQEDDVVLAMDRPWVSAGLKIAFVSAGDLPCLQVQRTARLRVRENLSWRYLFHLLRSRSFVDYILGGQTGLGVPHISGKQILSFEFQQPPLKTQKAIVKKLDALATETRRLEALYQRKLAALAELKQSLLQRAFSGKL